MAKILVTDDEQKIREMIRKYAEFEGFTVEEAKDGFDAVNKADQDNFDLIVMDVMMPGLDGFSAVKEIKKKKPNIPVIMLSALGEEYDKIHGFDLGVDDYVVKPFSTKELMMRIHAILKRTSPETSDADKFVLHDLVIDYAARTVTIKGERVQLSPKEYDLLVYLVKNRGIALTREKILETVWGYDFFGDDRTLDTHVKLLRKNIGEFANRFISCYLGCNVKATFLRIGISFLSTLGSLCLRIDYNLLSLCLCINHTDLLTQFCFCNISILSKMQFLKFLILSVTVRFQNIGNKELL